jgi:hypothetical protein
MVLATTQQNSSLLVQFSQESAEVQYLTSTGMSLVSQSLNYPTQMLW